MYYGMYKTFIIKLEGAVKRIKLGNGRNLSPIPVNSYSVLDQNKASTIQELVMPLNSSYNRMLGVELLREPLSASHLIWS